MATIIVDKASLNNIIAKVKDGDLIELTIVPYQNDCGHYSPAFLHLASIHNRDSYEDLESVDEYLANLRAKETA